MEGTPDLPVVSAGLMALMMVVLILAVIIPTPNSLFCWLRGGHLYEKHAVNFDSIFHDAATVTKQTHACVRSRCRDQRDLPIEYPAS